MLNKIAIKRFRNFKDINIDIPSRLILISGANGIGKSTLLGIIANGSGTKEFKSLSNKHFHPEFKDYFILSKDEHKDARSSQDFYEVTLAYNYYGETVYKRVRTSHPNETSPKLVPRTVNEEGSMKDDVIKEIEEKTGITGSGRIPFPTYFVSTSRLFPFGESKATNDNLIKIKNRKYIYDQGSLLKDYIEMYNSVLPRSIDVNEEELIETIKPKINYSGIYVKPQNASILTQSIGQDSLSGIINALLSFKNISKEPSYKGGILCIDELDASLHPDAQVRLLNLLKKEAESLNLQIFFTSHSLTIIKKMIKLSHRDPMKHSVLYFQNNFKPILKSNSSYTSIKADLFSKIHFNSPKVKVYFEDNEAKFAFQKLISIYEKKHSNKNLLNVCELVVSGIGCDVLINLPQKDTYFKDTIIILDGDAKYKNQPKLKDYLKEEPLGFNMKSKIPQNVITLPDHFSPEGCLFRALYNFSLYEDDYADFWESVENNLNIQGNYHAQNILNELDDMIATDQISREPLKQWFNSHLSFFDQSEIYNYYYSKIKNIDEVIEFGQKFETTINIKLLQLKRLGF
ncbi:AAA family ATPase [Bacillus halotolerans]|uniref:AAA family ATPase n=1 Tax=Bacillus halotolerans TaxID=260554 RepID=UPI00240F1934|nr:AAA family ATPase [Bacillus halotolerans]MDG3073143.1 AAA family ATPase [Bacillus halotolerans]